MVGFASLVKIKLTIIQEHQTLNGHPLNIGVGGKGGHVWPRALLILLNGVLTVS